MTNDGTSTFAPRASRRKVWGALAALLLIALGLLALAVSSRQEKPATADAEGIHFRVVDEQGRPISHAEVFVLAGEDMPEGGAGRWSDEDATLTLPAAVRGSAVAVQARGYRSDVAASVTADVEFTLRHGLLIRLEARGLDTAALGDDVLVFQIVPEPPGDLTQDQLTKIVDLMATLVPPPEGGIMLPAGDFGFAVQAAVAEKGLLLPLAGRYIVRWGLLDPASGMWFALPEAVRAVIDVADDPRTQLYEIPVRAEALQQTRKGLQDRVREMGAR